MCQGGVWRVQGGGWRVESGLCVCAGWRVEDGVEPKSIFQKIKQTLQRLNEEFKAQNIHFRDLFFTMEL